MKRWLLLTLLIAAAASADDVVRHVACAGDLGLLRAAQRAWLASFERDAAGFTAEATDPSAAADWLERSSAGAAEAGLGPTAAYLTVAAKRLRGQAMAEDLETACRRTLDEPLLVVIRLDGTKITDLVISTCDPARTREADEAVQRFERTFPGYTAAWVDRSPTRALARIARLHFRAGRNADAAPTGTYLPFDRALTPRVGRTWIVYENMIRAAWWGEGIRPIALRLFPADSPGAEAMIQWYGRRLPMYDVGPQFTPEERQRLGSSKDPLSIIKGDVLPVLLAGGSRESAATLAVVLFYTLADVAHGNAPPAHGPASTAEVNWIADRGGLSFDEGSATWRIDLERFRRAVRELAAEVMAIEAAGDAKRAEALFARYGVATPAITKTLQAIDALPAVKVRTVFVTGAKMPG